MKNKYQEALDKIINSNDNEHLLRCECCDILQELIDKENPMKPLKLSEGDFCGNCKYEIPENVEKYCPHCGQKLDWSDKDE